MQTRRIRNARPHGNNMGRKQCPKCLFRIQHSLLLLLWLFSLLLFYFFKVFFDSFYGVVASVLVFACVCDASFFPFLSALSVNRYKRMTTVTTKTITTSSSATTKTMTMTTELVTVTVAAVMLTHARMCMLNAHTWVWVIGVNT